MPLIQFHLVEGEYSDEQLRTLLERGSAAYAEVLESPVDRIRAFVTLHAAAHWAIGGQPDEPAGRRSPYFSAVMMAERPADQRRRALAVMTDLVVEVLGVERNRVRGSINRVAAEDWAIGGVPASVIRAAEVEQRKAASGAGVAAS
ncbi:tautomerase family protein [Derxia gummosa]|uniref:Tautomerase family protein n=1 Tax=Derxia gummosa DSM 723 TaxID=1121388 RepID=A0A8B6X4E2_9BURK|nr:tautomerase family protein [Derxia gummosa]